MENFKGLKLFSLKSSVGNMMDNDEDDVVNVKNALFSSGHRKEPSQNGIIEQQTDDAIRSFQKEKGLKVDGILKPKGETEKAIQESFDEKGDTHWDVFTKDPLIAIKTKIIATGVEKDVDKEFPNLRNKQNNEADAFRHALWSYRTTKAFGEEKSKYLTDSHERHNIKYDRQEKESTSMDIKNNALARKLALDPSNSQKKDVDIIRESLNKGAFQKDTKLNKEMDILHKSKGLSGGLSATSKTYYDER